MRSVRFHSGRALALLVAALPGCEVLGGIDERQVALVRDSGAVDVDDTLVPDDAGPRSLPCDVVPSTVSAQPAYLGTELAFSAPENLWGVFWRAYSGAQLSYKALTESGQSRSDELEVAPARRAYGTMLLRSLTSSGFWAAVYTEIGPQPELRIRLLSVNGGAPPIAPGSVIAPLSAITGLVGDAAVAPALKMADARLAVTMLTPGLDPGPASLELYDGYAQHLRTQTLDAATRRAAIAWSPELALYGVATFEGGGAALALYDARLAPVARIPFATPADAPLALTPYQGLSVTAAGRRFVVAFTAELDGGGSGVLVASVNPDLGTAHRPLLASVGSGSESVVPRTAWDGSAVLVSWLERQASGRYELQMRRYTSELVALGALETVSRGLPDLPELAPYGLASSGSGSFAVALVTDTNQQRLLRIHCNP